MSESEQGWSVPRLQRLLYLEVGLAAISQGKTFDEVRQSLLRSAAEKRDTPLAIDVGARHWDPFAFWSPTQETLGELMKLGFVVQDQLPSAKNYVDEYRRKTFALTDSGKAASVQLHQGDAKSKVAFLNALAVALFETHPAFSKLLNTVTAHPLCIPEFTIEELDRFKAEGGVRKRLGEEVVARISRHWPAGLPVPGTRRVQGAVREAIDRRFPKTRTRPSKKQLLDTINDAVAAFSVDARAIPLDAISFNVCMSWANQLAVMEQSRYVEDYSGRTVWATAWLEDHAVRRRGFQDSTEAVIRELLNGFRKVADSVPEFRSSGYLPIYRVRAQAAFAARVNVRLVDRILSQIVSSELQAPYKVQVALGRGTPPPPSEPIFKVGGRRFYDILITEGPQ